jgi:hypothetical protein
MDLAPTGRKQNNINWSAKQTLNFSKESHAGERATAAQHDFFLLLPLYTASFELWGKHVVHTVEMPPFHFVPSFISLKIHRQIGRPDRK